MNDAQMSDPVNNFFANVRVDLANKIPDTQRPAINDEGLSENVPMLEASGI